MMTLHQTFFNCFIVLCALCWGSFLNVVAYRLLRDKSPFSGRSLCPQCNQTIAWYDLVPIFSWALLLGKCRFCRTPISLLYPLIELITATSFLGLILNIPSDYWIGSSIFFSALIITIRTDLEQMLIIRHFTLGIIPLGLLFSFYDMLPITPLSSIVGMLVGYGVLWIPRYLSKKIIGTHGMGQGDLELLAAIGSFLGPLGAWSTLLIGALLGSCSGIFLYKTRFTQIPFGPFLALGGILTALFQVPLYKTLFGL